MLSRSQPLSRSATLAVVASFFLALVGCRVGGSDQAVKLDDAKTILATIENEILASEFFDVVFDMTSLGRMESAVKGRLRLAAGGRVHLEAQGTIAGEDIDIILISDGKRLYGGPKSAPQITQAPSETRQALVKGLLRMALLHNLAQIAKNRHPERADGGIDDWVSASEFYMEEKTSLNGTSVFPLHFDIKIGGRDVAEATLWISPEGKPVQRRQTVYHANGATTIKETYSVFEWGVSVPDETIFTIPAGS